MTLLIQVGVLGRPRLLPAESETRFFFRDPTGDTNFEFVVDDRGAVTQIVRSGATRWTRK